MDQSEQDADGSLWRVLPLASIDASLAELHDALTEPLILGDGKSCPVTGMRIRLAPGEGSGCIDLLRVSANLFVMTIDAIFENDREIIVPGDRMVKVRVLLSGRLSATGSDMTIDGAGAYLEAYPGAVASSYRLARALPTRMLVLHCAPAFFTEDIGVPAARLPAPLNRVLSLSEGPPEGAFAPLGPDLLRAANDMFRSNARYARPLRNAYLDAKSREIVCAMVNGLWLPQQRPAPALSVRDVNRVYEARDIVSDRFRTPPTIAALAREVGLNQTKLKSAFKTVFGLTINEFTLKMRMERGSELLTDTSLSISEIAYATGYRHPANFTHAYKRFYGHAPRQLRRARDRTPARLNVN